ncbi:MAG TPA: carboxymuconolactone decarboxylase family protein [Methylomirabilota bacterium]|nr:carboxymuconolactone decarboxylase family protein [Methylomirabilota bacterium]
MRRAPELEQDQAPEEIRRLYDVVEQLPDAPRLTSKVLAHSPAALRLLLEVTRAMTTLTLDPRLRELAFVAASRLNRSAICDTFHSSLGRKVGLTPAQLDGLAEPSTCAAYGELERLVIRYAEQLTVTGEVDDALHAALAVHLPNRQLIELALTVAAANFSNRVNAALKLDLERS